METILSFDEPKKAMTTEAHNKEYMSDCGVPGTFVPNMSKEDMEKWKAKYVELGDTRIEIRKTMNGVQLLIIVYKYPRVVDRYDYKNRDEWNKRHNSVVISMNGKLDMSWSDYYTMGQAIKEARDILT